MRIFQKIILTFYAMGMSCNALAYPGESIELNPVTGDYTINYWVGSGLEQAIFVPATKIAPSIQSKILFTANYKIAYRYTVANALLGKQDIGQFIFESVSSVDSTHDDSQFGASTAAESAAAMAALRANKSALTTPVGWDGGVYFGYYDDQRVRVA